MCADSEPDEVDLAQEALRRARGMMAGTPASLRRRAAGARGGAFGSESNRKGNARSAFTGAHPDHRDPQLVESALLGLASSRGWTQTLQIASVLGRWDVVVGEQIAQHCKPDTFSGGVLLVRADSTAWATQLKLLAPTILARLQAEIGPDVLLQLTVRGPDRPNWRRGPRIAPGSAGPRDTYG
jgi:predicted nucleic acid-binding Zn ribbon protein